MRFLVQREGAVLNPLAQVMLLKRFVGSDVSEDPGWRFAELHDAILGGAPVMTLYLSSAHPRLNPKWVPVLILFFSAVLCFCFDS